MVSSSVDYYTILGLAPSAEDFLIVAAYRALVKKYHPDVYPHEDGAKRIRDINAAYEVLGDPEKRTAYDRGYNSSFTEGDSSQLLSIWDFINIKANIEITDSVVIKIPPGVFLYLLNPAE